MHPNAVENFSLALAALGARKPSSDLFMYTVTGCLKTWKLNVTVKMADSTAPHGVSRRHILH